MLAIVSGFLIVVLHTLLCGVNCIRQLSMVFLVSGDNPISVLVQVKPRGRFDAMAPTRSVRSRVALRAWGSVSLFDRAS